MSRNLGKKISIDGGESRLDTSLSTALGNLEGTLPVKGNAEAQSAKKVPNNGDTKRKLNGRVDVRREKSGRGGKTVTTLRNFPKHVTSGTLTTMLFDLKKQCACGGTLKGRTIELQGDVGEKICIILASQGFTAVKAGG